MPGQLVPAQVESTAETAAFQKAKQQLGSWIWDAHTTNKQTCHFWRAFHIPPGTPPTNATLRITVDNSYTVYLDGTEIGRGSDYHSLTEYDVTLFLQSGIHVLAVEAFNDRLQAGLTCDLQVEFKDRPEMHVPSDNSWRVVPPGQSDWKTREIPSPAWRFAVDQGPIGTQPWGQWPQSMTTLPHLEPTVHHFWQTLWFQITLLSFCGLVVLLCLRLIVLLSVQSRSQRMLQVERARIARDIHDEVGSGLTQVVLQGEVAQTEFPEGSGARAQLARLCERARGVSHALDEVVWAVNSKRDTLMDFTSFLCKYAQNFLGPTPIRCRLDVQPDLPASFFDLPVRRGLLLAVKEALNNAARHSGATELFLRISLADGCVGVVVEDNGHGFDASAPARERNGITNMQQRLAEMGGTCRVFSAPGKGCRVEFKMPMNPPAGGGLSGWRRFLPGHSQPTPPVQNF
jgi:two-component sensor histidine kinase